MKRFFVILTIIIFGFSLAFAQEAESAAEAASAEQTSVDSEALWERANAAYNSGDYVSAIAAYEAITAEGLQSAALYYNMANAYFKNEQLSRAILYYHRALRLDPSDEDIRHNLEYAEQSTKDIIDEIPEFFLTTWTRSVRDVMGGDAWTLLSLIVLVVAVASAMVYLLAQRLSSRKVGFYSMSLCLLLFVLTTAFAVSARRAMVEQNRAVVMSSSVSIKSSPDRSSTELFVLHEGTTVRTGDEVDGWVEVRIADGRKGWIENSRIERI